MAVNKVAWYYEFGPFLVDPEERVLMRDGQRLALPPKAIETLLALLDDAGRIVEKDELLARIWPDCFVEEGSLSQAVFQLRKTLGESGSRQQYIETIPRRGYRFIAPVRLVPRENETAIGTAAQIANPFASAERRAAADEVERETMARPPAPAVYAPPAPAVQEPPAPPAHAPAGPGRGLKAPRLLLFSIPLLLMLLAFGAFYLFQQLRSAPPVSFEKMRFVKLTSSGKASRPALSPDGNYVAYVVRNEMGEGREGESLWVQQLASSSTVELRPPAEVVYRGVAFSRSGLFIYYVQSEKGGSLSTLYQIPLLGGAPKRVIADVDSPVTLSPDDTRIAFVRQDLEKRETALMVANADGSEARALVTRHHPSRISLDGPAWSPDGESIAYAIIDPAPGREGMRVAAVRVADGVEQMVGEERWGWIGQVAWLRGGDWIVCEAWRSADPVFSDQLWLLSYPGGRVSRLTNDLISYNRATTALAKSLLASERSDRYSRLWVGSLDSKEPAREIQPGFGEHFSEFFGLSWTPDGRILYGSQAGGNLDIWTMKADGSDRRRLTSDPGSESLPQATKDGRYIAFLSGRTGANHIWRMDADGSNALQLTSGPGERSPSVSPDGRWVVYEAAIEGGKTLMKVSIDGGEPVRLTSASAASPVISPDGRSILCYSPAEPGARPRPAIIPFEGGAVQFIGDRMEADRWVLQWAPDGRGIVYSRTENGVSNLYLLPLAGGERIRLTDFREDLIYRFAFSADGRTLACERGRGFKDIILISDFD